VLSQRNIGVAGGHIAVAAAGSAPGSSRPRLLPRGARTHALAPPGVCQYGFTSIRI